MPIDNTTSLDSAIAVTVEARRYLSDLHSEYLRHMGNLGYHRIAVGEEGATYYWSNTDKKDVPGYDMLTSTPILCPFQ